MPSDLHINQLDIPVKKCNFTKFPEIFNYMAYYMKDDETQYIDKCKVCCD